MDRGYGGARRFGRGEKKKRFVFLVELGFDSWITGEKRGAEFRNLGKRVEIKKGRKSGYVRERTGTNLRRICVDCFAEIRRRLSKKEPTCTQRGSTKTSSP